jgi:hypothetical protein
MANDLKKKQDMDERNKYLFREKCFLCHKDNPNPQDMSDANDNDTDDDEDQHKQVDSDKNMEIIRLFGLNPNKKLKKFPLWMCATCKKNCDNEEKKKRLLKSLGKKLPDGSLDFFNIEVKKPTDCGCGDDSGLKKFQNKDKNAKTQPSQAPVVDEICSCSGCKERR